MLLNNYNEFINESLGSADIEKASKSLKLVSNLIIDKVNPESKENQKNIQYIVTGINCSFELYMNNLIVIREKFSIKKAADSSAHITNALAQLELISQGTGASILLQDFLDEEDPQTKVLFSIKTSDLLTDKVQKFISEHGN